jgi:hypothetical protein
MIHGYLSKKYHFSNRGDILLSLGNNAHNVRYTLSFFCMVSLMAYFLNYYRAKKGYTQATRDGPSAWGLGMGLTTPHHK